MAPKGEAAEGSGGEVTAPVGGEPRPRGEVPAPVRRGVEADSAEAIAEGLWAEEDAGTPPPLPEPSRVGRLTAKPKRVELVVAGRSATG